MSTRSVARKTESWKDFLYSDPEGFIVQTVNFANGTTGRGLYLKKQFETQEFLLRYWGPRRATQVANFDYVMGVQEGKDTVFVDTSVETNSGFAMFINDKDKSVAAKCRMKKVHDDEGRPLCIFLATRVILPRQFNFSNWRTIICNVLQNLKLLKPIFSCYQNYSQNDSQKCFEKSVTVFECEKTKFSTLNVHFGN